MYRGVFRDAQVVSIYNNSKNYSRINNLKISNTSSEGVNFERAVYVINELYNTDSALANVINLKIASTTVFADEAWNNDFIFSENYTLNSDLSIGGTVYISSGTLKINGHKLIVDGNFNISTISGSYGGYLNMSNADDYIRVNNNVVICSYYSNNILTDGAIEVKGDFRLKKYTYGYSNTFVPSGNHKVILSGSGIQNVTFDTTESQFNILEITKPVDTGYVFSRTPLWNELIESASDDEPPTAPSNLHAESSTSTSIKISWNESEDKSGIYCYYIYRDGEQIGTSKSLYYVDNGLDSRSQHMYYVIAQDIDGNMSEKSNIIEAATDADEYAPTQPANLTAAVKSENTVYLSWIASSDNVKVVEYNVYRNGVLIAKTEGTAYTDKNAFAGAYTYYVEAVDDEGNVSTASNKVDVDNAAPSSPVLTVGKVTDEYISLEWAATDNVGVVLYGVYRDGVLIKTVTSNSYVDTNVNVDTEYTYYVIAYDAAENKSEASNKVTVNTGNDEIAPEITFLKSTEKVYSKTAKVSVSAEDNRAVTKFIIQASSDKAVWTDVASVNAGGRANETAASDIDLTGYADGELYLRAYAEDAAGNSGNAEDSPVISITVDNTAPEVPYEVAVNTENSIIELGWNTAENSADTEYFRIYRRVNDESDYTLIADDYRYWNYFDSNIELGTRYYYTVTAVDSVGNESTMSDEVGGCISDDKVKPEVLCVTPVDDSKIGENPEINISCYDNFRLKDLVVECKSSDSDQWTEVFFKEINDNSEIVSFTLDTSEFTTGTYQLKMSLTDSVLNKSDDYIVEYDYRKCSLSAPALTAEGAGWSVNLSWTMTNTEEIAGYYIYRKGSSDKDYRVIGSTTDMVFTDNSAEAGQKYYYYIRAVDIRKNVVDGNTAYAIPTNEDNKVPEAYAGEGLFGIEGKSVSFDGTGSRDNHYISSYEWDFGDGTTSSEPKPQHTYSSEGTYTTSLTVYDSAGNSNTVTSEITVFNKDYNAVKLRVRGSDGGVLSGARVYCEMSGRIIDATTNSSGCYDFIAIEGSYDVYVYQNGYIPQMITLSVTGEADVVDVTLSKGSVVVGELTTTPLELEEIIALGIDPKKAENRRMFRHTVKLEYDRDEKILWLLTNSSGDIIDVQQTFHEDWQVCTRKISSGDEKKNDSFVLFSIRNDISWLKDFYSVDLMIINNADDNFTLENCTADLHLPIGLSLAKTAMGEKSHIDAGILEGGKSKTLSWIVRGDSQGEYTLSADFNCVLTPFMENISLEFKNEKPLVVNVKNTLKFEADYTDFDPHSDYWSAKFTLTNISDMPIYDVKVDFSAYKNFDNIQISEMVVKYPSGLMIRIPWKDKKPNYAEQEEYLPVLWVDNEENEIYKRTLNPGESITGYYTVSDFQENIK